MKKERKKGRKVEGKGQEQPQQHEAEEHGRYHLPSVTELKENQH